jgi:hypothetical protein
MAYQIWLGNPYKMHYDWPALCSEVAKLFQAVIKAYDAAHKRKLGTVLVSSRFDEPTIAPRDLIVYVVPEPSYGFVGVDFGTGGRVHAGGLTLPWRGQVCSEVYVADQGVATGGVEVRVDRLKTNPPVITVDQKRDPECLAKLIYHEALHNRTGWGDRQLHGHRGVSLGKEVVNCRAARSKQDTTLMARNLLRAKLDKKPYRQWTRGWAAALKR